MPKQENDVPCNYFIVGVFDFLGQSKRLRSSNTPYTSSDKLLPSGTVRPSGDQLLADPDEHVRERLLNIAAIPILTRFFFEAAFTGAKPFIPFKDFVPQLVDAIFKGLEGSLPIHRTVRCSGVGDSSFVAIRVSREDHPTEVAYYVHRMLEESMKTWLITLGLQHPMRGGIEFGLGLDLGDGEVYGEALADAYRLESKLAKRPRILVGKRCISFLRDVDVQFRDSKEHDGTWARKCLSMLREGRTHTMVDTLGTEMLKICNRNAHLRPQFAMAHKYVQEQLRFLEDSGHRDQDAPTLIKRYRKLLDYFDEWAPRWRNEFREVREAEESGVSLPDIFGDGML